MRKHILHIRQSLSLKLCLGLLLLSVPIFMLALGILFEQSRHHIRQEATEHAHSMLNTTAQRLTRILNTVETATNANDWLAAENLQPDSLLAYTRRTVWMNANVNGCSITMEPFTFPQYGRYFSAYSVREGDSVITVREGAYEYFEKVWYKTPQKLGKACWVDPFDDFNEGTLSAKEMIASYCKPLYHANGQFIGVFSTDLSLRMLSETICTEKPYPNAYFMMLGQDGHYFVHPDTSRLARQTIFSGIDAQQHPDIIALGHEMTIGNHGAMKAAIDGETCLVCYQPVPGTHWSLALVCPESDILKSYNQLTYVIIPLIIIGLLLILLLCYRIVIHAIRPLSLFEEQLKRIANGQYDEQIPHSSRPDAIGQLQDSFATMQQSLDRYVSSIRQMNAETAQRNEELMAANHLAEEAARQKTAFIQDMTHQIRTPLNIIIGFAQVLRDGFGDLSAEEVKSITDMMKHNTMTLNRMVLMLYDSSETGLSEELKSHKHERVPCNEVAREAIAYTNQHYPDLPIAFETALPDAFCIYSNRLYLMRSLREVLYNAAKYSDGQHVSLRISKTDTCVRFIFQDTGKGIATDYLDKMFAPFTKVDNLSEGLGLGLPLAKRHIVNLGGDLTLDTDYHDGCRFIMELPYGKNMSE